MPRPASELATKLRNRAIQADRFLRRLEALSLQGGVSQLDIRRAYAGTYLEFYASVERSIEELFLSLLMGRRYCDSSPCRRLVDIRSDAVARRVMTGGDRSYADWLPYKKYSLKRAKAFFSSGGPFAALAPTDIKALDGSQIIRNALAHQSKPALRAFHEKFIEGKHLPPREQSPAGYLRGWHTIGQTRLNYIFAEIVRVFTKVCA